MCQKFSIFQLLLKIQKLFLLITLGRGIVLNFFQQIWNQCEILRFLIPISIFSKKKIFRSY
jgi:cation transporter-like permease